MCLKQFLLKNLFKILLENLFKIPQGWQQLDSLESSFEAI